MESGSAFPLSFAYHSKLAPMLWVFMGLATIELVVVHFLISFWSPILAAVLSLLTLGSILWLVRVIRSMKRLPVVVDSERLLMPTGTLNRVEIEGANIAAVRTNFPSEALKEVSVLNLALLSYPNVLVELREPLQVGRRPATTAVAHCLEDAVTFSAAAEALRVACLSNAS